MKYIRANMSFEEDFCQARRSSFCPWLSSKPLCGIGRLGHEMVAVLAHGFYTLGVRSSSCQAKGFGPGFRWKFSIEIDGKAPDHFTTAGVFSHGWQRPGKFSLVIDQILLSFMQLEIQCSSIWNNCFHPMQIRSRSGPGWFCTQWKLTELWKTGNKSNVNLNGNIMLSITSE